MVGRFLSDEGITAYVATSPRPTGRAIVLVDEHGDSTITISPGANAEVTSTLVRSHAALIAGARAVLLQHETPVDGLDAAASLANGLVVLNPAPARPVPASVLERLDVLVPNAAELAALEPLESDAALVVTLGGEGCRVVADGVTTNVPARSVEVVDATAAGDTFCAALVDGLLSGLEPVEAAGWATKAAAVTVTRAGAADSVPHRHEVD